MSEAIYRDHTDAYVAVADVSLPNARYDRPEILRLAGDVRGRRVLELGCAAGALTELLVDGGADVVGLDREPAMLRRARERVGDRARFEVADLGSPLTTVDDASVDVVTASLVLHYLPGWGPLLAEVRRVLRPGGALVFSVHHPITGWQLSDGADYHRTELVREPWDWEGLHVVAVTEPQPLPLDRATARPDDEPVHDVLATQPVFLFVRARRP